jgi:hypothetical protein
MSFETFSKELEDLTIDGLIVLLRSKKAEQNKTKPFSTGYGMALLLSRSINGYGWNESTAVEGHTGKAAPA